MSITTAPPTLTEAGPSLGGGGPRSVTPLVHVGVRRGTTVIRHIRSEVPVGLRPLTATGGHARVALVQTGAAMVSGDDLSLRVILDPGARLELLEISATVAYPVRPGGAAAALSVAIELAHNARLVLAGQPLIVADGAQVRRSLTATLAGSAVFIHRDTVVLGRHGEPPGALVSHTRVVRDGRPILDEALDTSSPRVYVSAAVLGGARVVDTLGGFGLAADRPDDAFALGPTDTLVRRLGPAPAGELDGLQSAWVHAGLTAAEA